MPAGPAVAGTRPPGAAPGPTRAVSGPGARAGAPEGGAGPPRADAGDRPRCRAPGAVQLPRGPPRSRPPAKPALVSAWLTLCPAPRSGCCPNPRFARILEHGRRANVSPSDIRPSYAQATAGKTAGIPGARHRIRDRGQDRRDPRGAACPDAGGAGPPRGGAGDRPRCGAPRGRCRGPCARRAAYHRDRARHLRRRRVRALGQDRRPRRRRRRPCPGARARARRPRRAGRGLPPALPLGPGAGRRGPPGARRAGARPAGRGAGPAEVAIRSFDAAGYRLRLVDHPPAFDRDGFYGDASGEFPDNAWRFGLLARAALETRRAEGRPVDVVALHDWHACPGVLQRDLAYGDDPLIGPAAMTLTIHNLAYHGWTPRDRVAELGLGADPPAGDGWGIDLLREGIVRAEMVNTVSPTYAREVLGPEMGMGLESQLRARGARFVGILNGLDQGLWDPATDPRSRAASRRPTARGKAACRADLCARVGLDPADPAPILGVIGRLDPQKGFDLVAGAAPALAAGRRPDRGPRQRRSGPRRGDAGGRGGLPGTNRDGRALRPRPRPPDLRRRRPLPDAVPLRAVRPGPDDRDALRHAARSPGGPAAWPTRSWTSTRNPARAPASSSTRRRPTRSASPASGRSRSSATRDRTRWEGLVRRGMAVDWAWERSSAPAYAAMFRRAVAARKAARGGGSRGRGAGARRPDGGRAWPP